MLGTVLLQTFGRGAPVALLILFALSPVARGGETERVSVSSAGLEGDFRRQLRAVALGERALRGVRVPFDQPGPRGHKLLRRHLRVADTGIGMPQEQLGRVFEAFTQAEESTVARYGGSGIGLTLVRRFCELLGGD